MPLFKQITSLNEICSEWVWQWLYHCLKLQAHPADRQKQREYVIQTLNPSIRQQMLNRICNAHMYQVSLSCKCFLIEMLGDKSTHCLDVSKSGFCYVDEVFQFYRTLTFGLLLNLTRLGVVCNVRCISDQRHVPDLNVTFYRVFNQMHNLRRVTLSGLGDTTILGTLGSNCHHLEYLDVSNSPQVNDEGISRLLLRDPLTLCGRSEEQISRQTLETTSLCRTLTFICISGTNITTVSVIILLHYLTNINSLGGFIDCGSICKVIRLLQPEEEDQPVKVFRFNELHESLLTPEDASLLCLTCPKLSQFTTTVHGIQALHILHPIESLTLEDIRGDPWYIYNYLQMRGSTLKELILHNNLICPLDLAWIVELTPNLERIEGNIYIDENYEVPDWKKLKRASVMVNSSKALLSLLTHAPNLVELSIKFSPDPYSESSDCLNDDLIIYVALSGGLKHLEKLAIKDCAISMRGIDCLLMHCPELWYFGYLYFWQNVTQEDIKKLRNDAVENNWKLKAVIREDWEGVV